jgi:hypothetical protein
MASSVIAIRWKLVLLKVYFHHQFRSKTVAGNIYWKVKLSRIPATSSGSPQLLVPRLTYLSSLYAATTAVVTQVLPSLNNHLILVLYAFVPSFRVINSFEITSNFVPNNMTVLYKTGRDGVPTCGLILFS